MPLIRDEIWPRRIAWFAVALALSGFALSIRTYKMAPSIQASGEKCTDQLKLLGLAFAMYAESDRRELYPALSSRVGCLMPDAKAFDFRYTFDVDVLFCPADVDRVRLNPVSPQQNGRWKFFSDFVDDYSYFYLGYLVVDDDDVELFAREYRNAAKEKRLMNEDYKYTDAPNAVMGGRLFRLRQGIERAIFVNDSTPSRALMRQIPILIERIDNHDKGGHVLYLDGYVEFIKYPGKWPMTERTVRILNELDALGEQAP